jgi:acyl-CoA synthetase (AMP-forming)/AMP-acid ligase II
MLFVEQIREKFRTIKDILSFWSSTEPEKAAYTFLVDGEDKTETVTYSALEKEVKKIASHLISHNLQGERVLLLYPSGMEYITAFLSCLYAGVIAVPAYPPRPNRSLERISSIVSDSKAKGALITEKLLIDISKKFPKDKQAYMDCNR